VKKIKTSPRRKSPEK